MKTRFVVGLLFLMLFVVNGRAQQQTQQNYNGYWWLSSTPSYKLGWVSGYGMAMESAYTVQAVRCVATMPMYKKEYPNTDPKVLMQTFCPSAEFDYDGIAMGQFVDGMDAFYNDYRNKQLTVDFAIQYVRDSIKGKSPQELEAEVTMWRACAAAYQSGDKEQIAKACSPSVQPNK